MGILVVDCTKSICRVFKCQLFKCQLFKCQLLKCQLFKCQLFKCLLFKCQLMFVVCSNVHWNVWMSVNQMLIDQMLIDRMSIVHLIQDSFKINNSSPSGCFFYNFLFYLRSICLYIWNKDFVFLHFINYCTQ